MHFVYLAHMMRRSAAILLLFSIVLNTLVHAGLLVCEWQQARKMAIEAYFSQNYRVIKVPASLYLSARDSEFEAVAGKLNIDEEVYQLVKQRVKNDTLEIYCVRDLRSERLQAQFQDFIQKQLGHDGFPQDGPLKKMLKSQFKDFTFNQELCTIFQHYSSVPVYKNAPNFGLLALLADQIRGRIPSPPPELFS
jgi:hypothetical protein